MFPGEAIPIEKTVQSIPKIIETPGNIKYVINGNRDGQENQT